MRLRSLVVLALLALVLPAANAGAAKSTLVHIVKRHGAITATLTYTVTATGPDQRMTLVVRSHGDIVLRHRVLDKGPMTPSLSFRYLTSKRVPAAVVDSYLSTSIALVAPHPAWIVHDWGRYNYRGVRVGGRYYFVAGDDRFMCVYWSCAGSWVPVQIWAIKHERLVDVTKNVPTLVVADARSAWRSYLQSRHGRGMGSGVGLLAGWCGDEFTLGHGSRCERVLRQKLAAGELNATGRGSGRWFVRTLNRDLERWGYKH